MLMASRNLSVCALFLAVLTGPVTFGQEHGGGHAPGNFAIIGRTDSLAEIVRKAAHVVPSPRQLAWQEMEFIAFVHFGMNTFTDREWGLGTESPSMFNPTGLDARQWVRVIKDAGMKMLIITAKHHDGFCLWPSKYTEFSVKSSPWRGGKGDVVREIAAACREAGLKFGFYLSPWDRHEPTYGDSVKYNEHFLDQLRELLTNYGEVSEVWFDGANGEGPNGRKQVYDWPSYYRLVRQLQPHAVIAVMGPDVRWVGTESGYGRETEWSVLPGDVQNPDSIAAESQQNPLDKAFVPRNLLTDDLGSREKLRHARALIWYPSETDVSIRPGWFYHANQDGRVKSPSKLAEIYYSSVGRNSVLLLNIPPDRHGRIHRSDIRSLMGLRRILDQTFASNLAADASAKASSEREGHPASAALDRDSTTYWTTEEGVSAATVEFTLPAERTFDCAMLQEEIRIGQRVERFHLDAWNGKAWMQVAEGTTIGYKRLLRFPAVTASKCRLVIEECRTSPTLSSFGLFKAPARVVALPQGGAFEDSMIVRLAPDLKGAPVYYTLDGTTPTLHSRVYTAPLVLKRSTIVTAVAGCGNELCVETTAARFIRSWQVKAISFEHPFSEKYRGHGTETLTDGMRGSDDFQDGRWLGFEGDDMVATLDLGTARPVSAITVGFLQNQGSWIFLPSSVSFSVSADGTQWTTVCTRTYSGNKSDDVVVKDCTCSTKNTAARYVRVSARNRGTCPPWHPGAGGKAWLFVDEISVQ